MVREHPARVLRVDLSARTVASAYSGRSSIRGRIGTARGVSDGD
ncbi:hypothetical protein [Haloterrigena salifodinae]|nr:hypothetical protein [Haloterrigena salifodinae]